MLDEIFKILINAGIVHGFFSAFVIWRIKNRFYKMQIPLNICISVIIAHNYYLGSHAVEVFKSPYIIAEPFIFLIGPLLYFHFRYIAYHKKLKYEDFLHFIPFLLFFISFIPVNLHGTRNLYYDFLFNNPLAITALLWILMATQMIFYWNKMNTINKDYREKLGDELSEIDSFDTSWIHTFTILFLIIFTFVAIVITFIIHTEDLDQFRIILPLFFTATLFYISFKGITQKIPTLQEESTTEKTPTVLLDQKKEAELKKQLSELMQEKQPFLNPELTLKDLAVQVGISRNQLSYLINNSFNSNFYLYVNNYRIEYLKRKMMEDKQKQFTILALAFDSGFNSKSSFNAVFKKITGLTPSEYRNRLV